MIAETIQIETDVVLLGSFQLITVQVGSNDICSDMCYRSSPESLPDQHRQDLREALRILKKNLPRTFVNIAVQPGECVL